MNMRGKGWVALGLGVGGGDRGRDTAHCPKLRQTYITFEKFTCSSRFCINVISDGPIAQLVRAYG